METRKTVGEMLELLDLADSNSNSVWSNLKEASRPRC